MSVVREELEKAEFIVMEISFRSIMIVRVLFHEGEMNCRLVTFHNESILDYKMYFYRNTRGET